MTRPVPPELSPRREVARRSRRRPLRWVLTTLLLAVLAHLVLLGAYTTVKLQEVEALPGGERPEDTPTVTWLLVGSDSREDLSPEERAEYSTGDTDGKRTDTIILVSIPPEGEAHLVSLPRDSYLPIPGEGEGKLNSAYALGGPQLLVESVEAATGTHIDHYLEIGLRGIVTMTDAVGGVEVCLSEPIQDEKAGIDLPTGCQSLAGTEALGYVRTRYQDPRGDLGRIERQQTYLNALISELTSTRVLLNPVRQWKVAAAGTESTQIDGGGITDLADLGLALKGLEGEQILTVPVADPDHQAGGESSVLWDFEAAGELFTALREGRAPAGP